MGQVIAALLLCGSLASAQYFPPSGGGGGATAPGGSTTQIQYNNAGAFGGITGATTDGTALTLVAPVLGAATATSINKLTFTTPATSATLTLIDGTILTGPAISGTAAILGANTFTGIQTFPAGTVSAPSITFGDTNTGIYAAAPGYVGLVVNGVLIFGVDNGSMATVYNNKVLTFDSGGGNGDVGITRNAVGVLEVNSGTAGTLRDLSLRNITASGNILLNGSVLAQLGTPTNGTLQYCSDCTVTSGVDNTCSGSGAGAYAFRVNGAWKCLI